MRVVLSLSFLFIALSAFSQNKSLQALSIELGKNGIILNAMYDHQFSDAQFGLRAGAGSNFAKYMVAYSATIGGYKLFGKKNSFLETGIDIQYLYINEVSDDQKGFVIIYPDFTTQTLFASLNIGYRKQFKKALFRVGASPGFTKHGFLPGGYLSYGISW